MWRAHEETAIEEYLLALSLELLYLEPDNPHLQNNAVSNVIKIYHLYFLDSLI